MWGRIWREIVAALVLAMAPALGLAQALPVTPMQNAVSGVLQAKMQARGFASNDPRYGATLNAAGGVLGAAAGTGAAVVVAGAVTAPAWVTAAVGAGVFALVSYGVTLAVDGVTKWLFGTDSTKVGVVAAAGSSASLVAGGAFWRDMTGQVFAGSPESVIGAYFATNGWVVKSVSCTVTGTSASCNAHLASDNCPTCDVQQGAGAMYFESGSPYSSSTGVYVEGVGPFSVPGGVGGGKTGVMPIQTAVDQLTPAERSAPLNPEIIADIANKAWQLAAQQSGYGGLPAQMVDPVTAADAAQWQKSNPSAWPTVGDFVAPQPAPSGGTAASPFQLPNAQSPVASQPSTSPNGDTSTNPSTQPQTNLGADPGIGAPGLAEPPTALAILDPLLKLMPDIRLWVPPTPAAECPRPVFKVFDQSIRMDSMCDIAEQNLRQIYNGMLVAFALAALFIVLSA